MSRKAAKSMSRLTPPRSHHDLIDDLLNGLERTGDEALELMRHSSIKERMFK
jgi:hypothetical protein